MGCGSSGEGPEQPCAPLLGSPDDPAQVAPELRAEDGSAQELADGGILDLVRPPQGGHVVFVGARATGICADNTLLRGELFFEDETFIAREARTMDLQPIDDLPGWGRPNYSSIAGVANVPVCPNNTGRALLGTTLLLEAEVEDRAGKTASGRVEVMLRCGQIDAGCRALCECECDENYDIGVGCDLPKGTRCELESQ